MATSPYVDAPRRSFWRCAVAQDSSPVPYELYVPKWKLTNDERIATAGSCFAQHIGRHLRRSGCNLMDLEPAPAALATEKHGHFGFSMYSARYGNIYTARQLLQLAREAFGEWEPHEAVWEGTQGTFFDALRPGVEPAGLDSPDEVRAHRSYHLGKVREMLESMDVFIFTLGLTETWEHRASGTVYPTAPGTIAGSYDPAHFNFHNLTFEETCQDLVAFKEVLRTRRSSERPSCRILLTVSPVPLTATATSNHVMVATVHSKAVLRAVAGELCAQHPDVDYFPSYEIVANPWARVPMYQANLRAVAPEAVSTVMSSFLRAHSLEAPSDTAAPQPLPHAPAVEAPDVTDDDVVCEQALMEALASADGKTDDG